MKKEINSNLTDNMIKSFKELNESVNINSIIGAPISVGNRYIIPISKLTVGYLGGGGEYGEIKLFAPDKSHPFAGGSGTVVNMSPVGFLVCEPLGVHFIKTDENLAEKIFDKTTEILNESIKL